MSNHRPFSRFVRHCQVNYKWQGYAVVMAVTVIVSACNAFFLENIEDQKVVIILPIDGAETEVVTQSFLWDEIEGVDSFNIQIVSPNFANAGTALADTIVHGTHFVQTLYPGTFEWRIRGINGSYYSQWNSAVFTIYATDDLTRQQVRITAPADNLATNKQLITLKWDKLYNAQTYRFTAYQGSWGSVLVVDTSLITTNYLDIELPEGNLTWGIQAINDISETTYATRNLLVDRTSPEKPILMAPANLEVLNDTIVSFSWTSKDATNGAITDSVLVYKDLRLSNLVKTAVSTTKKVQLNLQDNQTYYWRVRSMDKAGNLSTYSSVNEFITAME